MLGAKSCILAQNSENYFLLLIYFAFQANRKWLDTKSEKSMQLLEMYSTCNT
jgi:hypothetical protein